MGCICILCWNFLRDNSDLFRLPSQPHFSCSISVFGLSNHSCASDNSIASPLVWLWATNHRVFSALACLSTPYGAIVALIWTRLLALLVQNVVNISTHEAVSQAHNFSRHNRWHDIFKVAYFEFRFPNCRLIFHQCRIGKLGISV